jgi:hypothetical protein
VHGYNKIPRDGKTDDETGEENDDRTDEKLYEKKSNVRYEKIDGETDVLMNILVNKWVNTVMGAFL